MADVETQDSQKTLVAFVVGLLIGGMLVWAFSGPSDEKKKGADDKQKVEMTSSTTDSENGDVSSDKGPQLAVGDANIKITDQAAGKSVKIDSATYPVEEGWIAVRDYQDDKEGFVLGAVRFSKRDGLVPSEIELVRPTVAGKKYAISLYKEDGDTDWGNDERIEGIFGTFMAQ
ncbi:MAG: hypothetical protein RLZZ480_191 [Candidatus Parcubacteria bacterium]|jgi:hypothetical protein